MTNKKRIETKWLILIVVMLALFMSALDNSIVNTVLPVITTSFNTDISIVQWVPTAYLLAISCSILLCGRLGDMVGHKKVFLSGLAAFTVASTLCGSSQSIWMLIAFRGFQGFSASMLISVVYAIATETFSSEERGKALGILSTAGAVALGVGPVLGGFIAEHLGWRYIFFINIPVGITALFWGSRIISHGSTKLGQRLDLPGAFAAVVFLPALLLYFNKGKDWGWGSPVCLILIAVAIVFGVLFFQVERTSKQPMLNLKLFANRTFGFASLSHFLYYIAIIAIIFLTPFYLKFVLNYSMSKVGLVMSTFPVFMGIVSPLSGALSDRIGTRILAIGGMCITSLGLFLLSGLQESATTFNVVWCLIVASLGISTFGPPNTSTIMGSVPTQYLGITSGIYSFTRYMGMVFGLAVTGAILYALAPVSVSSSHGSLSPDEIEDFLYGLHWAYISGGIFAAAGVVTSILAIGRLSKA